MMKKVLLSLMTVLMANPAFAATGKTNAVAKLLAQWGGGNWDNCGAHAIEGSEACIGATKNCKTRNMYARNYTDEFALQMMVAVQINEHGAQFCPIQVEAKNKNKKNAWTEYALIGGTTGCQWLCKDGYSGMNCSTAPAEVATCNPAEFKRSNYDGLKRVASGANIEDDIAMFNWNHYYGCGLNKGQEHDSVLAITRWAPGGHGAFVQPLIVRAQREGWKDMVSWPSIYYRVGASEVLACMNGYKPNAGGTDCVEISANICAEAQACSGWSGFDETLHKFVQRENSNCFEFRCKGENMAFVSASDRTCVECPSGLRGGASPVDGTCVKCDSGKVFNNNATSAANHCGDAYAYTKTDMQYGKGKTKNNNPKPENQCWTKMETDVYRECVVSGSAESDTASLRVPVATSVSVANIANTVVAIK